LSRELRLRAQSAGQGRRGLIAWSASTYPTLPGGPAALFRRAGIRALPDLINRLPNDACGLERVAKDVTRRRVAILGIAAARAPRLDDAGQNDQAARWSL
jgi:hypothetical protein